MDDLSRKRLESAVADGSGRMDELIAEFAKAMPVEAYDAEIRALGVPPAADTGEVGRWIGYVIGNMVAHHRPLADCHDILAAISGFAGVDPYDICTDEKAADALDKLGDSRRGNPDKVYRWARFMRVGLNEIVFSLEDHFTMIGMHPGAVVLHERAVAVTRLIIDTLHPAFVASQIDSH